MTQRKITKPRTSKGRAVLCARLAAEKQATDILLLDMSDIDSSPAEFFVIGTVNSETQMRAVTDHVQRQLREVRLGSPRVDGTHASSWMVLDYFDVVVHIMTHEARVHYNLERLWGDAKPYGITESGVAKALKEIPRRTGEK